VVDELINLHLFAGVAEAEGFKPPAAAAPEATTPAAPAAPEPADRLSLGEAWARATFVGAEPTEADLAAWFVERRAVARIIVKTQEAADAVVAAMRAPPPADVKEAVSRFAKLSREHDTAKAAIAPRRVLFDAAGRSEVGEPVVAEAIATAAFALAADGDVSPVISLGDGGDLAVVQRVALRPAMKTSEVPAPDLERAKDGLRVARANALMKTRAGELRGKVTIAVEPQAFADLRPVSAKGRFLGGGLGGRPGAIGVGRKVPDLKAIMQDPPSREMPHLTKDQILEEVQKGKDGNKGQR
jgi:hypothetical protein